MAAMETQEPMNDAAPRKSKAFRLGGTFKRNSKSNKQLPPVSSELHSDTQATNNEPWTFPTASQIAPPPETFEFSKWYNFDQMDSKVEAHLSQKFASEIAALDKFNPEVIVRFVIGYRHTAKTSNEYEKRAGATEQSFATYLEWHKLSRFASILEQPSIHKLPVLEFMAGTFVYGHDKYGHPLLWDTGAKFTKTASTDALLVHKQLNAEQMDQVLGYSMRLLAEVKAATNRLYGFPVTIEADDDVDADGGVATDEVKQDLAGNDEDDEKGPRAPPVVMRTASTASDTKRGDNYRQVGIYRHCLIFDLKSFNSKNTLKERKLHEYYTKRGSLIGPDVVHRVYVINAPKVFQGIWKILRKFLHPNTIQKTIILGTDYLQHLTQEIDIHMIPPQFGGKGEWEPQCGNVPKGYPIQLPQLQQ